VPFVDRPSVTGTDPQPRRKTLLYAAERTF